jgi:hypothetical protein
MLTTAQQQWLTGYSQLAGRSIQERSFRSSTSTIHAKHMRCAPQCVYTATMRIIDIIITPYLRCICRSHHPHIYTAFVMAKLDLSGKCMRDMLSGRLHYLGAYSVKVTSSFERDNSFDNTRYLHQVSYTVQLILMGTPYILTTHSTHIWVHFSFMHVFTISLHTCDSHLTHITNSHTFISNYVHW